MTIRIAFLFTLILLATTLTDGQQPTDCCRRVYSVIPTPQKVVLDAADIEFNDSWFYDTGRIAKDHIAIRSLLKDLEEFHHIQLRPAASQAKNVIRFSVTKG